VGGTSLEALVWNGPDGALAQRYGGLTEQTGSAGVARLGRRSGSTGTRWKAHPRDAPRCRDLCCVIVPQQTRMEYEVPLLPAAGPCER